MAKDDAPPSPPRDALSKPAASTKIPRRPLPLHSASSLPRSKTTPVLPNHDLTPVTQGHARSTMTPLTPTRMTASPNAFPAITAEVEGRKKGHSLLDVFKKDRSSSRENSRMPQSPLPPIALNSPKALKLLGLPAPPQEGVEEHHQGKGAAKTIYLTPDMVQARDDRIAAKLAKEEAEKANANDLPDHGTPKTNRLKKASHVLGISRPKSSGKDKVGPAAIDTADEEIKVERTTDHGALARAPRSMKSAQNSKRRRRGRKRQKSLEAMAPITEASGEAGFVITTREVEEEDIEEDQEEHSGLGVISEYQYAADEARPLAPGTRSSDIPTSRFELEDDDLSSDDSDDTDDDVVQVDEEDEGEAPPVPERSPGRRAFDTATHRAEPRTIGQHLQSPLQHVESLLLDNAEKKMTVDAEETQLKHSHLKMKEDIKDLKRLSVPLFNMIQKDQCKDDDSFDGDTYLDEEATLHTATESSLVRITARMVKMIDIKPSKATSSVEGRRFNPSQTDLNNIFSFRDENLLPPPPPTSSPKSSLPPSLASFVFPARGDSLRGHADDQNPDDIVVQEASGLTPSKTHSKHVLHDKKQIKSTPISPVPKEGSAMRAFERQKIITPSEVSRPNLEAWFYTTDLAATKHERPYSVLDPDVVSDRLLDRPPSPPPKHDPFRNLCANNAHVFQTIDTKKLPDEIGIDNLQVRADVTTPTGDRQHMRIAVTCDVCGKVVSEIYSQCEFQSCQYALCFQCGEDWRKGLFVGNY